MQTAVELASQGWRVFASMRDLDKRTALDARAREVGLEPLDVVQLDVTDAESSRRAVAHVLDRTDGRLHALVSNAGTATGGAFEDCDEEQWRRILETNFFGSLRLTQLVLPVMRRQRAGRLVFVSSTSGRAGSPAVSLYCASKWALEGWAESLAYEVEPFGIKVVLVEPGVYDTAIWRVSPRISPPDSAYVELLRIVESFVEDVRVPRARDPQEVARAISRALTARKPRFRYSVGPDAKINGVLAKLPFRFQALVVRRITRLDRWRP
jgi:NAD(P)-dependent dehydrogenase (short-subunit alcohol dehydrogenase family)